jgi:transcriptional regulator with XRE-family HTH domain
MNSEINDARAQAGLSQIEFAQALHISVRTLQEWEQNRRSPSGSARALIKIAQRHPEIIRESYDFQQDKRLKAAKMLDDMASHLLSGDEIAFSDLILDWYREEFECQSVPQPTDPDELRIALKASILERLVDVLNSPPHNPHPQNNLHKPPQWCKKIGAVSQPIKLQSDRLLEDEQYCEVFQKRNLLVVSNFMFFV